ncbi:MAG: nucleotidyltransferase family protein [Planctomycetales bacterium]|nr:nucleotidyltransferase family protein [Planctomycetales bacterium]MBN8624468.1 nucleotidyltransferase family protein [Planctomycetota bacterium]
MHALILCAGFGTRLGEHTREIPKPMLDLGGRPLVEYIVRNLAACGFTSIAMNLHFLPEVIPAHFGDGESCGVRITYSYEPQLLGTAGGVKKMADTVSPNQPFLVHYGDVLNDVDFGPMVDQHRRTGALVTMLVHQRPGSNSIVGFDEEGRVNLFLERPTDKERHGITASWVNSGVWICSPELLEAIPENTACDMARDILPKLVSQGRVFTYKLDGYRCAVDSEQRLFAARKAIAEGTYKQRWLSWTTESRRAG